MSKSVSPSWRRVRLAEVLKQVNRFEKRKPDQEYRLLGVKWYEQGVFERERKLGKTIAANFDHKDFEAYCLSPGNILLNEGQRRELVVRPAIFDGPPRTYCSQNTLIRVRRSDLVLPLFAQAYLQMCLHEGVSAQISRQVTSVAHLIADSVSRLRFSIPTVDEHRQISITLNTLITLTESVKAKVGTLDRRLMTTPTTDRERRELSRPFKCWARWQDRRWRQWERC